MCTSLESEQARCLHASLSRIRVMKKFKVVFPKPIAPELDDPIGAVHHCQTEFRNMEKGYCDKLYEILALSAHVSKEFDRNQPAWIAFVKNSFWDKEKIKPRPKKITRSTLSFVMQFVLKAQKIRAWK